MEEILAVEELSRFPAERLEPERRLSHVDMSVVQGGDISEDMQGIDRGGRYIDCVYMAKTDNERR